MSNESTLCLSGSAFRGAPINDNLNQAKRIALQQLRSLKSAGLDVLPAAKGDHDFDWLQSAESTSGDDLSSSSTINASPMTTPSQPSGSEQSDVSAATLASQTGEAPANYSLDTHLTAYVSDSLSLADRTAELDVLKQQVSECTRCEELANCRNQTVFGVGNPQAELCFLGEGPGADEDRQGEPFVGAAGQLLNKIIEACQMQREEVYILNTVKCRPPGNRNPNEQELANCWPYAIQQLELLQPKFICCLGSVAAKTLLQTKQSIGRMRGQFFSFRGSQVIVTYHPAYLLRNPSAKRQVWDDMKMLLSAMGREV